MSPLRLSENIITLRKKKGITQEELASFLGVTKASVSKWETRQSYPDILLLPQLASYFDVSIDELLGYEPQLSPEQIKRCYIDLSSEFASMPFEEVVDKSKALVKKYYSCYDLLFHMALLWINHFMLTDNSEKQRELLEAAVELCDHIIESCSSLALRSDTTILKSVANLQLSRPQEVIDALEPIEESKRHMVQSDSLLIQAYKMIGDLANAELYSQVKVYTNLVELVGSSIIMMSLHMEDYEACIATISRITQVIDAYDLESLHPNITLQFYFQTAIFYAIHQRENEALSMLESFVRGTLDFLDEGIALHGDQYFSLIDQWFQRFPNTAPPRNTKVILDSLIPALEHPMLSTLFASDRYKHLKRIIKSKIEGV